MYLESLSNEQLATCIQNPDILSEYFFRDEVTNEPLILTPSQTEIVRKIILKRPRRLMIWATTRYGKSLCVALGALLACMCSPAEKIRIIAPTTSLAKRIKTYVDAHVADHEDIIKCLGFDKGISEAKLSRELSKERITFSNGSEISIMSAGVSSTNDISSGRTLLGAGGSIIIVDECESIPSKLVNTHIMRMAGERPDSVVILISNPIYKGFMYEHMNDPSWETVCIDWETSVREGRLTREFIEDRKRNLTEAEFTMWYEARYPEDSDNTLIKWEWIQEATDKKFDTPGDFMFECVGIDPAGMGKDLTVMTHIQRFGNCVLVKDIHSWGKKELIESGHIIADYMKENKIMYATVDDTGLGGLAGILREMLPECAIVPINFGGNPTHEPRASNMKAELYLNLRRFFIDGEICIPNHNVLRNQLNNILVEGLPNGKQRIDDGQSKSPDFSDSLALACWLKVASEVEMGSFRVIR